MTMPEPAEAPVSTPPVTFALYFARQLIAKRGFTPGAVPEANQLASYCDYVLSFFDGYQLTIVAVVDREASPGRRFELSPYAVEIIGETCLKYSRSPAGRKMPVLIQIFEIGPGADQPSDRQRLATYAPASWFSKIIPSAWIVDTITQSVWTNSHLFVRVPQGRGFVKKLLHAPREPAHALRPPIVAAQLQSGFPWLTCVLLAVLTAMFTAEVVFAIGGWTKLLQPSIATLVTFGGLTKLLVQSGEWYRLFSAPLLHGDAAHLTLNGIALFLAGRALESLIGRAWFGAILVVAALCGSALSLVFNPSTLVSVGASGAVMGAFATMLVLSLHFPPGASRSSLQMTAVYVLLPSLLPLAGVAKGHQVDYAAHFGGAFGGVAMGLLLLAIWPQDQRYPRLHGLALAVAFAGLLGFSYSVVPVWQRYPAAQLYTALMPPGQIPQSDAAAKAQSASLVANYPRDPRARLLRAGALLDVNDVRGAERELRAGLAEEDVWRHLFPAELAVRLRTVLALVLARDRMDEARVVAKPACSSGGAGPSRQLLDQLKLCEN